MFSGNIVECWLAVSDFLFLHILPLTNTTMLGIVTLDFWALIKLFKIICASLDAILMIFANKVDEAYIINNIC